MEPEVGTEAACSKLTLPGFRASHSCRTDTNSAKAPPWVHWWLR